jgi:hypothetical protein
MAVVVCRRWLGEFANPRDAHSNYEDDARVIDLMVNGIDSNQPSQLVQQQCAGRKPGIKLLLLTHIKKLFY